MSSSTPDAPAREKIINPVQLAAGAGASVTAAVAGSFLGVAGTLIGAAVASVVSSVAVALYKYAIETTGVRIRRRPDGSVETQPVREKTPLGERLQAIGWKKLLIPAVLVFAAVLVILTSTEAIAGKPVSAVVTGNQANGTTLTQVSRGNVGAPQPVTPVVSQEPTPTATELEPAPTQTSEPSGPGEETPSASATPSSTASVEPSSTTTGETISPKPTQTPSITSTPPGAAPTSPSKDTVSSQPDEPASSAPQTAPSG